MWFTDALGQSNAATSMVLAGKYICVTTMSLDSKVYGMMFFDFDGDESKALKVVNTFDDQEIKNLFMHRFNELKSKNKEDFKKVKLVIGKPHL